MASKTRLADRMEGIQPFHVMDLLARARALEAQGHSVIHMEIGEPDFNTPEPVITAGQQALTDGLTHYTPALGLPELRQTIADFYQHRYQLNIEADRIVVTPGASGALQLITSILVNPGDEVIMADPGYPCNRHFVRLAGGTAVGVPVGPATSYQLSADNVRSAITNRSVAIMAASPSNPTGTMLTQATLESLIGIADEFHLQLVVDEIYHGLVYAQQPPTTASLSEQAFVINSFSKYFGMTGWRLGWAVVPADVVDAIDRLAQNIFLAPSTLAQHAALVAFSDPTLDILEQRRLEFARRRGFLLPALRDLGFDIAVEPEGAFYLYADCSRFTDDSFQFCQDLLQQAHVAVTPGIDFGDFEPEKHVRFAYTTQLSQLEEGVSRIKQWLSKRGQD